MLDPSKGCMLGFWTPIHKPVKLYVHLVNGKSFSPKFYYCFDIVKPQPHDNVDGSVNMYKGYAQTHNTDYAETFNSVMKMTTVHVMLVIAVTKGWH